MHDRVFKKFNQQSKVDELNRDKHVVEYGGKDPKLSNKLIHRFQKVDEVNAGPSAKRAKIS